MLTHYLRYQGCIMRQSIVLGLLILLTSCSTTNYYTQSVGSWRGASVNPLISRWGRPDIQMPGPDGKTLYVYHTQTYRHSDNRTASPAVGVNYTGGRPVVVVQPNTNGWDNNSLSLTCVATFETNTKGIIVGAEAHGNGCYGSQGFADKYSNR